jgi:hypothetical protein
LPAAVRQAMALTFGGLTVEQLAELLPILGIELGQEQLHEELKRLDRQLRINYLHGRVTASEVPFDFRRRVRDKESTPGLAQICERVKKTYAGIVEQPLSNLSKLRLILGEAPDGLWHEEIAEVARYAGIDLADSAIECVPRHEGKGTLKSSQGRVELLTAKSVLTSKSELKAALVGSKNLDRMGMVLCLLRACPAGLSMHELAWACRQAGEEVSTESFIRWMYGHQSLFLQVNKRRVVLTTSQAMSAGEAAGTPDAGPDMHQPIC